MKIYPTYLTVLIVVLLISCMDYGTNVTTLRGDWIISKDEVISGGPGRDGIPSIDNPKFLSVQETTNIPDDRRVVGIKIGSEVRAYPHQILDWHEIVNDTVGGKHVAITFCPLTGTAIGFNREIDGEVTEFGVSGLLYRNNLIPYDRNSSSNWSQMQGRSVEGALVDRNIDQIDLVETTWATWKEMYPESEVLSQETGFSRNYKGFAYGSSYSTDHSNILFPIRNEDGRLDRKDRVHGIYDRSELDGGFSAKAYPIVAFGDNISVVNDTFDNKNIVIVGSNEFDFMASFYRSADGITTFNFEAVQDSLPIVMKDQFGNQYDMFGYVISGPDLGEKLEPTNSYTGYWFAWADFYKGLELFGETQ